MHNCTHTHGKLTVGMVEREHLLWRSYHPLELHVDHVHVAERVFPVEEAGLARQRFAVQLVRLDRGNVGRVRLRNADPITCEDRNV